jgi:DNA-binding SARP family transcriptional activator
MPRRETPIQTYGPVAQFAGQLRALRRQAGLTYRDMAGKTKYSPAAFSLAASGRTLPTWNVIEAFVCACGDEDTNLAQWRARWEAAKTLAASLAEAGSGEDVAPHRLDFHLLGPVRAVRDGAEVDLGSRATRTVLAVLLLNANQTVSTDRLIDALWGKDGHDRARENLMAYVSRLRRTLGSAGDTGATGAVVSQHGGYSVIVEPGRLDYHRFQQGLIEAHHHRERGALHDAATQYQCALDEWSGEALAGLTGPFVDAWRVRLAGLKIAANVESLTVDLDLGRYRETAAAAAQLCTEHPFDEELIGLWMLALYRNGRTAEALDVFHRTRRRLIDELGMEPSSRLRDTHAAILRQDPSLLRPLEKAGPLI